MRLTQIVVNLVGNALKFTERGHVGVTCRVVDGDAAGARLRWEVTDTGCGVAPGERQRIFEAFEQSDSSLSRRSQGTGLGLAICRRLCHLMDGEIGVESVVGAGSTFWFTVRLDMAAAATAALPAAAREQDVRKLLPGRRVLLVEDDPIGQLLAQTLLEDAGVRVDVADDGVRAVHRCGVTDYELILMDLHLPGMDGLEATRAIRNAGGRNTNTPILALTANSFDEDRQACVEAGMSGHISKPIEASLLYRIMADTLDAQANRRCG